MKIKTLFPILVCLIVLNGCVSSDAPVSGGDAAQVIAGLESKTFEMSRNEILAQPFPEAENWEDFNFIYPIIMDASTTWSPGQAEPRFMKDLAALLRKDLGIGIDYQKLARNTDYKITKKAGFVTDPELFWPIALEKVKTGKQHIEIYTKVLDSLPGLNPAGLTFQTFIRVKRGSTLLKEYQIRAGVDADVAPADFRNALSDYFTHIPELLSLRISKIYISKDGVSRDIDLLKELREKRKFQKNLPEKDLLRLKNMVFDEDPLQGISTQDAPADTDTPGTESPGTDMPDTDEDTGAGATLLD